MGNNLEEHLKWLETATQEEICNHVMKTLDEMNKLADEIIKQHENH